MSAFSLDNSEVVRAVLHELGLGRDPTLMDAATEADVRAVIRSGLRRFYFPTVDNGTVYNWRFLEKWHAIPAEPVFSTGTIAVSAGTVTLTGGVWPSDITNYFIRVSGHALFVTARNSDTEVLVSHNQLTVAAGAAFTAEKYRYALPSDFGHWRDGVVYAAGGGGLGTSHALAGSSESELRLRYAIGQSAGDGSTAHYAISSVPDAAAFSILFWPIPEAGAFIQGVYVAEPDDNLPASLTAPGNIVQVQPAYAEAVLEAILSAAEEYSNNIQGVHTARFESALHRAIQHDKAVGGFHDFNDLVNDHRRHGRVLPIDFSSQI